MILSVCNVTLFHDFAEGYIRYKMFIEWGPFFQKAACDLE